MEIFVDLVWGLGLGWRGLSMDISFVVIPLVIFILHDLKDPKLWE